MATQSQRDDGDAVLNSLWLRDVGGVACDPSV